MLPKSVFVGRRREKVKNRERETRSRSKKSHENVINASTYGRELSWGFVDMEKKLILKCKFLNLF